MADTTAAAVAMARHAGDRAPLCHWRRPHSALTNLQPFFCQIEAAETAIWLTEVAAEVVKDGQAILDHFAAATCDANPELMRFALKPTCSR